MKCTKLQSSHISNTYGAHTSAFSNSLRRQHVHKSQPFLHLRQSGLFFPLACALVHSWFVDLCFLLSGKFNNRGSDHDCCAMFRQKYILQILYIKNTKSHKCIRQNYIRNSILSSFAALTQKWVLIFYKTWSQSSTELKKKKWDTVTGSATELKRGTDHVTVSSLLSEHSALDRPLVHQRSIKCWSAGIIAASRLISRHRTQVLFTPPDNRETKTCMKNERKTCVVLFLNLKDIFFFIPESCIGVRWRGSFPTCVVNEKCTCEHTDS